MALNFDFSKCKDIKYVGDKDWSMTDKIIWLTMVVGIPEIKEDNAEEFYKRVNLTERLFGGWFLNRDIELEDIKARIGLKTNVAKLNRAKFVERQAKHFFDK